MMISLDYDVLGLDCAVRGMMSWVVTKSMGRNKKKKGAERVRKDMFYKIRFNQVMSCRTQTEKITVIQDISCINMDIHV
jgi:hypothetical protein